MSLTTLYIYTISPNAATLFSISLVFNATVTIKNTQSPTSKHVARTNDSLCRKLYRRISFGNLVPTSADRSFAQSVFPRRLILTLDSRDWLSRSV